MAEPVIDIQGLVPHRACRNCVQIKVKCIPQAGLDKSVCERCHRLRKTCTTPAPITRKRRRSKTSKVAQLEERINRLSTLLTPANTSPDSSDNASKTSTTIPASSTGVDQQSNISFDNDQSSHQQTGQRPHSIPPSTSPPTSHQTGNLGQLCDGSGTGPGARIATILAPPHLSMHAAGTNVAPPDICPVYLDKELEETLFTRFRLEMLPFLPFVVLSASLSTQTIKRERPFLFWAGCAVAAFHTRDLHKKLNDELMKTIGEQMLFKGHKSLDLLQSILVLIAWYQYYGHLNPCLCNLLHLAQALTVDLGLNRPSHHRDRADNEAHVTRYVLTETAEIYHGRRVIFGVETSDERRALLGVYYWHAKIAVCCGRLEFPPFNAHLEQCCQDLETSHEHDSDLLVVSMVRLHRLMERFPVYHVSPNRLPLKLLMTMFADAISTFERQLPPALNDNRLIQLELNSCRVCFYGSPYIRDDEDTFAVVECLHTTLIRLRAMIDGISTLTNKTVSHLTFASWFLMTQATAIYAELSFLKLNGWDLEYVREHYSFPQFLQSLGQILDSIAQNAKEKSQDELYWRFDLYAEKLRRLLKWYESRLGAEDESSSTKILQGIDELPDTFTASMFDGFDDFLWQDIMGNWTNF